MSVVTMEPKAAPVPRRLSRASKIRLARLVLVVALLALWELGSGRLFATFWVSKPSLIAVYLWDWIVSGDFFHHLAFTMGAMLSGFAAGTVLGLAAGMWLSRAPFAAEVLDPFLVAMNGIPRVALAPLFVVWFGIDMLPKIVLVFTLVFFVIFYNTYAGIRSVDRRFTDLAWVMGASETELFLKVILPAATPYIFLGIKLSIPYALIGAIIGEFVASSAGLGWKIQMETSLYNTTGTMAGLIVMMTIVVAMNAALNALEARLLSWRPEAREVRAQGPQA
ncbi:ABC transporter permease [Xanthobacter sp. KR7-65]|uniref:ABC transporter permease n=1 Tax=Xanthobacter sp. KR7-65 TaxID=3156612 RepID=UPI0032B60328